MELTPVQKAILDRVQKDFPFSRYPWKDMAGELGLDETTFLEEVTALKNENLIRDISGIFNGTSLGYVTSLVALQPGSMPLEEAAAFISSHPGVSHNYQRDHEYALWFTLAEENQDDFDRVMDTMKEKTGARELLVLNNEKLLKIGVHFSFNDESSSNAWDKEIPKGRTFPEREQAVINLLQQDLPLEREPFHALCEGTDIDPDVLMRYRRTFTTSGFMRRYAAVIRHGKSRHKANSMTVWKKDTFTEDDFNLFREYNAISHLYLRTLHPGKWDYPLFAMIHATSEEELENHITHLSRETGADHLSLKTVREFKKERVKYFSPRFSEWKRSNT